MLLPPKVQGPINQTATSVTVLGALEGADVQVFVDGTAAGFPTTASGLAVVVDLGGDVLSPGQKITATQSLGPDTSIPSPFPETVAAAPSAATGLPAVAFLSALNTCSDWALIGGTIPGATVEIRRAGQVVGATVAGGANVSVPIRFPAGASAGDVLEASQTFTTSGGTTITGDAVPSLPLQPLLLDVPPKPTVAPPYECDMAVLVSGLDPGTSLVVRHGSDQLAGYPFVGTPVWASLVKPARDGDQLSASQGTEQCGAQSGFSTPVGVNPAPLLPTPVIVGPVCPNAPLVRLRNLRPGAVVTLSGETQQAGGGSASAQIGQARAWATDCDFALPPNWSNHPQLTSNPGRLFLTALQTNCEKASDTAKHPAEPLPGLAGQPAMTQPVECGRVIAASNLTPGAVVSVHSDAVDWPTLSGPVLVTAATMVIDVYRPLRAHEHVQLKQVGCVAASESASTEVAPFGGLQAPVIAGPVRVPHGGVNLKNLIVGARVHVFVNSMLAASVDATAPSQFVPVPGLTQEALVVACQTLCTEISDDSDGEHAIFGVLSVSHAPSPLTRTQPQSVTVTAKDGENDQVVAGKVRIGGSIVGTTGTAFGFTFPAGAPPASRVEAPDYDSAAIAWNLVDPPPQPPKVLQLSVANQASSFFTIVGVQWNVLRQELDGTLTPVGSPTGLAVAVTPPTTGQYHVHAEVSVDDLVNGGTILAEFRGNTVIGGVSRLLVVWSNAAQTKNFRLFAEPQTIWGGGTAVTVYYPVVVLT